MLFAHLPNSDLKKKLKKSERNIFWQIWGSNPIVKSQDTEKNRPGWFLGLTKIKGFWNIYVPTYWSKTESSG